MATIMAQRMGRRHLQYTFIRSLYYIWNSVIKFKHELLCLKENFNSYNMWKCEDGKYNGEKELYLYIVRFFRQYAFLHIKRI